jgi:hypothetical protein
VERGKVVSKGETSGEVVHATLVSNTVTLSRTFSHADLARGWVFVAIEDDRDIVGHDFNDTHSLKEKRVERVYPRLLAR